MRKKLACLLLGVLLLAACDDPNQAHDSDFAWNNDPVLSGVTNEELDRAAAGRTEKRCGWLDNPSPGNASLIDQSGEWIITMQGMFGARGDLPSFDDLTNDAMFVPSGVAGYGYGCACLDVKTLKGDDVRENRIVQIIGGAVYPLAECRKNRKLKEPGSD